MRQDKTNQTIEVFVLMPVFLLFSKKKLTQTTMNRFRTPSFTSILATNPHPRPSTTTRHPPDNQPQPIRPFGTLKSPLANAKPLPYPRQTPSLPIYSRPESTQYTRPRNHGPAQPPAQPKTNHRLAQFRLVDFSAETRSLAPTRPRGEGV